MKNRSMESLIITLVLWFFLGWAGGHRWYTGHYNSALALLLLHVIGGALLFVGVGAILLWIAGTWLFIDLLLILFGALRKPQYA
jgi:hypothetical protein